MQYAAVIATIFLILTTSCTTAELVEENPNELLYYNSFESSSDLEDFIGNAYFLSDKINPEAGDSCLAVCGGCIGPHWNMVLGGYEEDKELEISFLARSEHYICGAIYAGSQEGKIQQYWVISDTSWTSYIYSDSLFLEANDFLTLGISSGGAAPCFSYLDELRIEAKEP